MGGNYNNGIISYDVIHNPGVAVGDGSYLATEQGYVSTEILDLNRMLPYGGTTLFNPTGLGIRNDLGGQGHFGAKRGNRSHYGLDFKSSDGQNIISPVSGRAINSSFKKSNGIVVPTVVIIPAYAYSGFDKLELLYVGPIEGGWHDISAGDVVGQSVNLQGLKYPASVTSHIHLQMKLNGKPVDPTPYFFFGIE